MSVESYTPGYTTNAVEFMRKRSAQRHAAFFTPLLRPGMRLLDCGCGPGSITLDFAGLVAPGEVTGIDREGSQFSAASATAALESLNVRFQVAELYELPFAEEEFDAIFAHAVFEHLQMPGRALAELRRVLRPGGCIGLRSPDWGGFLLHPWDEPIQEAIRVYTKLQTANGGDVYVGRRLAGLLRDAGFAEVRQSASYERYEDPRWITEYLARRLEGEAGGLAEAMRRWGQHRDAFFAQAWCEAIAVLPK